MMIKELAIELATTTSAAPATRNIFFDSRSAGIASIGSLRAIDLADWDCLALSENPQIKRAAVQPIDAENLASRGVRADGVAREFLAAEDRLAQFFGLESALLFSSRNQTLLSLVTALLSERDALLIDESAMSAAVDAAQLVNAEQVSFSINNLASLEEALMRTRHLRRRLLVVESVSPLTGRCAPLTEIFVLAQRSNTEVIVDESHALAALGYRGAGLCESLGLALSPLCIVGSLAFGVGSFGGFLAGPKILSRYILSRSRTLSTEPSFPSSLLTPLCASLEVIEAAMPTRLRLRESAEKLSAVGISLGFDLSDQTAHIRCFPVRTIANAYTIRTRLLQLGYLTDVVERSSHRALAAGLRIVVSGRVTVRQMEIFSHRLYETFTSTPGTQGL